MQNFKIKKHYGQHFLKNNSILDKIVKINSLKNLNVIEIGPGSGALTKFILKQKPKSLVSIEKDKYLKPYLDKIYSDYPSTFSVIYEDILELDITQILEKDSIILGNLPYNIATTLIMNFLKISERLPEMIFMVQKEVADRITAKVSTKSYGRVSVLCQLHYKIKRIFDVSPENFFPKPKVFSTVLKFSPKKEKPVNLKEFDKLVKNSFCYRRKTIKNNLEKKIESFSKVFDDKVFSTKKRPQDFSPKEFVKIFEAFKNLEDHQ